jgi:hypothetical protein
MIIDASTLEQWMEVQFQSLTAEQSKPITSEHEASFYLKCQGAIELLVELQKAIERAKQYSESVGQAEAEGGEPAGEIADID